MQEGDAAFRELEFQALAQVKGAAGLEPSLEAMHQVFGHEGDAVLTRRGLAALLCAICRCRVTAFNIRASTQIVMLSSVLAVLLTP